MKARIPESIVISLFLIPVGGSLYPDVGSDQILTLREAERIALENSVELRLARREKGLHKDNIHSRFRDFFPTASLSYRQNRTVARRDFDNGRYSVQMNLSQPVYDGGRSLLAYEIAKIDARVATEKYRSGINDLRFRVREGYFQVLQRTASVSISKLALASTSMLSDRARIEIDQGAIAELDYREIQNEHARRTLAFEAETAGSRDARIDFGNLLRLENPEVEVALLDLSSLQVRPLELNPEALTQMAYENRPDLREARMNLARDRREYLIAQYDYLPQLALTGHYGKTGEEWPPRTNEWGIGVSLTWNLFGSTLRNDANLNRSDSGESRGLSTGGDLNIYNNPGWRQSRARSAIALARTRQLNRDLLRDIANRVERQIRSLREQERNLRLQDEALAIREVRHLIDQRSLLNGELSVHRYFEEELKLIQARYDLLEGRIQLLLAINRLEIDLGLEVDHLQLVNLDALSADTPDSIERLWRPVSRPRALERQ
ncbi:MAG: TolC family protein [Spirochaetales bacterium]|nr:TolC family protein [Spirochaetales bacterium]